MFQVFLLLFHFARDWEGRNQHCALMECGSRRISELLFLCVSPEPLKVCKLDDSNIFLIILNFKDNLDPYYVKGYPFNLYLHTDGSGQDV